MPVNITWCARSECVLLCVTGQDVESEKVLARSPTKSAQKRNSLGTTRGG